MLNFETASWEIETLADGQKMLFCDLRLTANKLVNSNEIKLEDQEELKVALNKLVCGGCDGIPQRVVK